MVTFCLTKCGVRVGFAHGSTTSICLSGRGVSCDRAGRDGGKKLFLTDSDHLLFLDWLDGACKSHGWRIHAWVLMGNHFHLLLETPEPNLVSGMKWLLGGFSQAWNRRYKRTGHVFQGRYKSIPVSGERASDPYHFRIVADYIHLNPARAKLVGGRKVALSSYRWSSLPAYAKGKGPEWFVFDRVIEAFSLAHSGRGRRAYEEWLEIRAAEDGGRPPDAAMQALRKGWYLGEDTFRDKLLALLEKGAKVLKSKGSHSGPALQKHDETTAEKIVQTGLQLWKMPDGKELEENARKGDTRKVAMAILIKRHTSASNIWIAERLGMGHDRSVSRLIKKGRVNETISQRCKELEKNVTMRGLTPEMALTRRDSHNSWTSFWGAFQTDVFTLAWQWDFPNH